jgi:hypothetical protein
MTEKLRFTGEWPPLRYWSKYPNWEYALDEEGEEGQDETTLRPADVQTYVAEYTAFTAGDATCPGGARLPALLEISYSREPDAVNVFNDVENSWRIYYSVPSKSWMSFVQEWLPESERGTAVDMHDSSIFPLTVTSRLPRSPDGIAYHIVVYSDGSFEVLV